MNSYTHSGFLQVTRRNTASSIEPNYTEDEILETIQNVNTFSLFIVMGIANLAGNEPLMKAVLEKVEILNKGSN